MNKEDFCTYSQAVRLKKLGFDWECIAKYGAEPDGKPILVGSTVFVFRNSEEKGRDATAPTLAHAQKWLREEHSLYVDISTHGKHCWTTNIVGYSDEDIPKGYLHPVNVEVFDLFEQALSAGLDVALELLEENSKKLTRYGM